MKLAVITNDLHRVAWAGICLAKALKDEENGTPRISAVVQADLLQTKTNLNTTLTIANELYHDQRDLVDIRDAATGKLETVVNHFWTALENRAVREGLPQKLVGSFYTNTAPNRIGVKRPMVWVETAEKIIGAHVKMVDAGFAPMANPAIEEVEAALVGTAEARQAVYVIEDKLVMNQKLLEAARLRIGILYREIYAALRIALSDLREAHQRRIIRTYGYEFKSTTGTDTSEPTTGGVEDPVDDSTTGDPITGDPTDEPTGDGDPITEPVTDGAEVTP